MEDNFDTSTEQSDTSTDQNGTMSQSDTAQGNTIFKGRCWLGTWNNHTKENYEHLLKYMQMTCIDFAMQEECGTNGTKHIQFAMKFKNARRFTALKKAFPKVHLEKCKSWINSRNYCLKNQTRAGSRDAFGLRKITDKLEDIELYDWQQKIRNMLDKPADERKIYWFWEETGCVGKTTLARHLCIQYPGNVLYLGGKKSDILYGVFTFLENPHNDLRMVILDFSRSIENFISWDAIESIKNGIFYNTKYKSGMCVFDYVHVICFANFNPPMNMLSEDRWRVINIG